MSKIYRHWLLVTLLMVLPISTMHASSSEKDSDDEFNPVEVIMHHIGDTHSWSIFSGESTHLSLPLPIILINNGNFQIFLSSAFEDGNKVVKKGDNYYVLHHEKIYETDATGTLQFNEKHEPTNNKPFDLSITRNVASMWMSIILLLLLFGMSAKRYKQQVLSKPKGMQSFMEPIILFVRDDIAYKMIDRPKADRYLPFLLTLFFFILINNLIGQIPFFPGGSNLTGNIALTSALTIFTFLITNFSGSKTYWKHIFNPPGVPFWVAILIIPVEIIGIFTKPFALLIRLFANITAGHIIILCLISLIFIMKSYYFPPVSILLTVFMSTLELLVALLQAFIFTLLTALFIGMAVHEENHHSEETVH